MSRQFIAVLWRKRVTDGPWPLLVGLGVRLETQHAARKHWQGGKLHEHQHFGRNEKDIVNSVKRNKILASATQRCLNVCVHLIITFYTESQQCSWMYVLKQHPEQANKQKSRVVSNLEEDGAADGISPCKATIFQTGSSLKVTCSTNQTSLAMICSSTVSRLSVNSPGMSPVQIGLLLVVLLPSEFDLNRLIFRNQREAAPRATVEAPSKHHFSHLFSLRSAAVFTVYFFPSPCCVTGKKKTTRNQ